MPEHGQERDTCQLSNEEVDVFLTISLNFKCINVAFQVVGCALAGRAWPLIVLGLGSG